MFNPWFPAGWNARTVRSDVASYHLFTPFKVVISRISQKKIILSLLSFVSISLWKTVWASSITWPTSWRPNVPSVSRSSNQRLILNWTGRKAPLVASARRAARLRKRYHLCSKLFWSWKNSHGSSSDLIFLIFSQFSFDLTQMPEESTSSGVNWLCHTTAMRSYLSLLDSSKKDATLEASCGALQNLTASKDPVSRNENTTGEGKGHNYSVLLFHYLCFFSHRGLVPCPRFWCKGWRPWPTFHLFSSLPTPACKRMLCPCWATCLEPAACRPTWVRRERLVLNIWFASRKVVDLQYLCCSWFVVSAKQVLPDLLSQLSNPGAVTDDVIAPACSTAGALMLADTEFSKKMVTKELVSGLADLSENGWVSVFSFHCIKTAQPPFERDWTICSVS